MGGWGCVVGRGCWVGVGGTSKQMTTISEVAVGWVRSLSGMMGGGNCIFWG
jgi:hypothetical protein